MDLERGIGLEFDQANKQLEEELNELMSASKLMQKYPSCEAMAEVENMAEEVSITFTAQAQRAEQFAEGCLAEINSDVSESRRKALKRAERQAREIAASFYKVAKKKQITRDKMRSERAKRCR